jgi:hypothetical protein
MGVLALKMSLKQHLPIIVLWGIKFHLQFILCNKDKRVRRILFPFFFFLFSPIFTTLLAKVANSLNPYSCYDYR